MKTGSETEAQGNSKMANYRKLLPRDERLTIVRLEIDFNLAHTDRLENERFTFSSLSVSP